MGADVADWPPWVRLYVVGVNRPARPPLYGVEVGRRRRRRRLPALRLPPLVAIAVVLLAVLAAGSAFVAYRLWPLTDRSAGLIGASVPAGPAVKGSTPPPPPQPLSSTGESHQPIRGVRTGAGVVVDVASGRVVWAHDVHRRLPVASLTKLMTALVALPRPVVLDRQFFVTPAMVSVPGNTIGLRAGQRVTVRRMLAAALIASANDAANVLAVHRAGSLAAFVGLMNAEAARLGLSDTHYSNPSGIFDRDNDSSAWDVADLSRYVLARPLLRTLVGRKAYDGGPTVYVNRNRLLWSYPGAIGLKTGSTTAAGDCLAVAATHRGRTLVAVLLHVRGDEFAAATRLLDWGFRHDP
jgi:serine-type D-Ala-D-Ala carboxypeptidase (penicillin-binding protein 5/6)